MAKRRPNLLSLAALLSLVATPALAYRSIEHKEIGDAAMRKALLQYAQQKGGKPLAGVPKVKIGPNLEVWTGRDKLEVGWFTFGDLVAAYGDLAASYEEMTSDYAKKNYAAFKDIAKTNNYKAHKEVNSHSLELASVNATHFSQPALETYARFHKKALEQAALGPANLWLALQFEALALHSYTDLFAFGHMMADRDATMALEEAAQRQHKESHAALKKGLVDAFAAELNAKSNDAEARFLIGFEVNFLHNGYNHWGAQVTNLAGETFQLYGDHRLKDEPVARQKMEEGAALSIVQVLAAANGTQPQAGTNFAAVRALPVQFKNGHRSVDLWQEKATVLKALAKQRSKVLSDGGLDAALLKKEKVPDGSVPYLAKVKELCAAACK